MIKYVLKVVQVLQVLQVMQVMQVVQLKYPYILNYKTNNAIDANRHCTVTPLRRCAFMLLSLPKHVPLCRCAIAPLRHCAISSFPGLHP
jgi:hypothetical protein